MCSTRIKFYSVFSVLFNLSVLLLVLSINYYKFPYVCNLINYHKSQGKRRENAKDVAVSVTWNGK